jgi:prepilin-type N-terminal cleavage/methylation domain-containing protein
VNAKVRQAGFSIIEMLVVIGIFSLVIIAASQSFVPLLSQSKQQSKIAATNIEGMLGLEVLRRDIAHAGYGLYWGIDVRSAPTATPTYKEVTVAADLNGEALNDAPGGNAPRAIVIGAGRGLNGSDRIAVKSVNVASNELSERWTYLYSSPVFSVNTWSPATENIGGTEYVIMVRPDDANRFLHFTTAATGKAASSQYKDVTANYDPPDTTSIIFSLGTTSTPKMPFNRADYYIDNANVPPRCAQGTGVLKKAVVDLTQNSIGFLAALPLLDCVADMQVGYRYATDGGAYANMPTDATTDQPVDAVTARQIREVRVYILVQEGQLDRSYIYSNSTIRVGEAGIYGRDFDLNATITNWQNYRWKLYTLIIETMCLVDWKVNP